jgi:hypothetical protein
MEAIRHINTLIENDDTALSDLAIAAVANFVVVEVSATLTDCLDRQPSCIDKRLGSAWQEKQRKCPSTCKVFRR